MTIETVKQHLAVIRRLYDAVEEDCGDPNSEMFLTDDGAVGASANNETSVTFKLMREAKAAFYDIEAKLDAPMMSVSDADEYVKEIISHDEAMEMISRMIHSHFNRTDAEHMRASIPANPKRDDDLRMIAYIKQQRMKDAIASKQSSPASAHGTPSLNQQAEPADAQERGAIDLRKLAAEIALQLKYKQDVSCVASLTTQNATIIHAALKARVAELEAEIAFGGFGVAAMMSRVAELETMISAKDEALEPLAKAADFVPDSMIDASLWTRQTNAGDHHEITVSDALKAKHALALTPADAMERVRKREELVLMLVSTLKEIKDALPDTDDDYYVGDYHSEWIKASGAIEAARQAGVEVDG